MAASTTGSTAACGIEPWAPRPWTVIRMLSAADSVGPARVPTVPAGNGQHVLGHRHIDRSDELGEPVLDHAPGAVGGLLRGLEQGDQRAGPLLLGPCHQSGGAEQAGDVHVVSAGVHHRVAVRRTVWVLAYGRPVALADRQRVHVGAQQHGRAVAVAQRSPTTPVPPMPSCTSTAGVAQPRGHVAGRAVLLVRELGVGVQVAVEVLLPDPHRVETPENVRCHRVAGHVFILHRGPDSRGLGAWMSYRTPSMRMAKQALPARIAAGGPAAPIRSAATTMNAPTRPGSRTGRWSAPTGSVGSAHHAVCRLRPR